MKPVAAVLMAGLFLSAPLQAAELSVAVAANFTAPMQKIAAAFEKETGHKLALSFGSTGKFYAQIKNGAPFEVLFAADDETPARLEREGEGVAGVALDTLTISEPSVNHQKEGGMPPVSSKAADLCPYQQIIDLYHEALPVNPRCKVVSKARQAAIKARWTEAGKLTCKPFGYATRAEGLAAWQQFFDICAESAYLTGQVPGTKGRPPFMADIDFLMSPSGFARTLENRYHREAAA